MKGNSRKSKFAIGCLYSIAVQSSQVANPIPLIHLGLRGQIFDWDRYPFQNPFDDNVSLDDSLEPADDESGLANFQKFAHDNETIAWQNRISEANIFQTAEADHRFAEQFVFVGAVAADLSDCLKHDDSGHERHARHVTSHPKFLVRDVFVTDARKPNRVLMDNRGQLFHFETLWIVLPDLLDIRDHVVEVDRIWIDDEVFSDQRRTPI